MTNNKTVNMSTMNSLKPVSVPQSLVDGSKFIKWDDVSTPRPFKILLHGLCFWLDHFAFVLRVSECSIFSIIESHTHKDSGTDSLFFAETCFAQLAASFSFNLNLGCILIFEPKQCSKWKAPSQSLILLHTFFFVWGKAEIDDDFAVNPIYPIILVCARSMQCKGFPLWKNVQFHSWFKHLGNELFNSIEREWKLIENDIIILIIWKRNAAKTFIKNRVLPIQPTIHSGAFSFVCLCLHTDWLHWFSGKWMEQERYSPNTENMTSIFDPTAIGFKNV